MGKGGKDAGVGSEVGVRDGEGVKAGEVVGVEASLQRLWSRLLSGWEEVDEAVAQGRAIWGRVGRGRFNCPVAVVRGSAEPGDGEECGGSPGSRGEAGPRRGTWPTTLEFVLASMGCAVGIGNIWRFPWLAYHYGGAFLIAYWSLYVLVALPCFVLELSLGQFSSRGPFHLYRRLCPLMQGLGWAKLPVLLLNLLIYSALFSVSLLFMVRSVDLPWQHCGRHWSTPHCFSTTEALECSQAKPPGRLLFGRCLTEAQLPELFRRLDECVSARSLHFLRHHPQWARRDHCSFRLRLKASALASSSLLSSSPGWPLNQSALEASVPQCKGVELFQVRRAQCEGPRSFLDTKPSLKAWDGLAKSSGPDEAVLVDLNWRGILPKGSAAAKRLREETADRADCLRALLKRTKNSGLGELVRGVCEGRGLLGCTGEVVEDWWLFATEELLTELVGGGAEGEWDLSAMWERETDALLFVCLMGCWVLTGLGVVQGVRMVGKVAYVTAGFPFLMLLALVGVAVTLPGAQTGLSFFVTVRPCSLWQWRLWLDALGQIYFSNSLGSGELLSLASYNRLHNDMVRDALVISLSNSAFSMVSGVGVFSLLGYLGEVTGRGLGELLGRDTFFIWIVFSEASATLPHGRVFSFFFYLMMLMLAVDCCFAMVESVLTFVGDEWRGLRQWREAMVAVFCTVALSLSLPFVSRAGLPLVNAVDLSVTVFTVPALALLSLLTVHYVYGWRRFRADLMLMAGPPGHFRCHLTNAVFNSPLQWIFWATWLVLAPLTMALLVGANIYRQVSELIEAEELVTQDVVFLGLGAVILLGLPLAGALTAVWGMKLSWRQALQPLPAWTARHLDAAKAKDGARGRKGNPVAQLSGTVGSLAPDALRSDSFPNSTLSTLPPPAPSSKPFRITDSDITQDSSLPRRPTAP